MSPTGAQDVTLSVRLSVHPLQSAFKVSLRSFSSPCLLIQPEPKILSPAKVEIGCDCCEVNDELVPDKHTWIVGLQTYGKNVKRLFQINNNSIERVLQR